MTRYRHTQIGYVLLVAMGAALVAIGGIMWTSEFDPAGWPVMVVLLVTMAAFSTLTVTVDDEMLTAQFGPVGFRRRFRLRDVKSYRMVRNPWYYGWGIHLFPGGWVFNVSGFAALELQMENGRKYRIGTDDPAGLAKAVETALVYMPGRQSR